MSKNKKIIAGVVAVIVVMAGAGGAWWYFEHKTKTPDITEQEAINIALKDSGMAKENTNITWSYDSEDNEYEVDLLSNDRTQEYDYTISGKNGKIKDKEVSTNQISQNGSEAANGQNSNQNGNLNGSQNTAAITVDHAKETALRDGGFTVSEVEFVKQKYDREDNDYDIEYIATDKKDGKKYKYEYEISASDGKIVKSEKDADLH